MIPRLFVLLAVLLWAAVPAPALAASDADLGPAFELLMKRSFDDKARGIEALSQSGHPRAPELLQAILDGRLYYIKKTRQPVFTQKQGSKLLARDAFSGEELGLFKKRKLKKISINNRLRQQLKIALARVRLSDPDPAQRLQAVRGFIGSDDPALLGSLRAQKAHEDSAEVIAAIDQVLAFADLDSKDEALRLAAIERLKTQLDPVVINRLKHIVESDDTPLKVRLAAEKAIERIESRIAFYGYLETLFFGLSLGSILALAAIGLAITFGVMGVINMAHGELIMIGAYTTYVVQQLMPDAIGASILVAIPAAFVVSGLVGIAIERGIIRFLYGRPLETLLATFGISLFLQQTVRSVFSPLNRSVETPQWMAGSLEINSLLSITYNRLYIFFFCLIVFVLLYLVMKKTSLGLYVRAVAQNRNMARAMGIRSDWVDAMTFGLGSGIAGVAGVALSQVTNVGPNLGQAYIVDSFMVVVFGGVGNLWGTLISGLSLGVVGKFLEPVSGAVLAKILVLVFIILFIQKRPRGLFPQKGRAAES